MMETTKTYKQLAEEDGFNRNDRQHTLWYKEIRSKCKHKWIPLSFVFETQMLDSSGRVLIKQPHIVDGRVYCVCMKCCSHTYIETGWVGYYIGSPDLLEEEYIQNNNQTEDKEDTGEPEAWSGGFADNH